MFVNNDRKLIKAGGRKAPIITKKELKRLIMERAKKLDPEGYAEYEEDEYSLRNCLGILLYDDHQIKKDKKFEFDYENLEINPKDTMGGFPKDETLVGFGKTDSGIPFLGCMAAGDWEMPLFFIIYYDGKKLRMYIPSYGNVVNLDFKCAFGSEDSSEYFAEMKEKYLKAKLVNDSEYDDPFDYSVAYLKKNGFLDEAEAEDLSGLDEIEKPFGDWDAVMEDINSRIEVVKEKRFMNDDRTLLGREKREAVSMSTKEFKEKLINTAKEIWKNNEEARDYDADETFTEDGEIDEEFNDLYDILEGSIRIITFADENMDTCDDVFIRAYKKLTGIHKTDSGIPYIGYIGEDEDEAYPSFYILYYDGESFKQYIPAYGNLFNLDINRPFRVWYDGDYDEILQEYIDEGIITKEESEEGKNDTAYLLNLAYLRKQNLVDKLFTFEMVISFEFEEYFNWKAIKEDIEMALQLKEE